MVAIVQDDVAYGRNLPGTLLFSLIFVLDLLCISGYIVHLHWRRALHYIPMLLDLITKAFLLHRPLTPSVKTLCIGTSAVTAISSIVVSYVFSEPHLNDLALFTPIQSALTAVILLLEHTLVGKLFIPFSRTNSEVVIM